MTLFDKKLLGNNIKKERERLGLTQAQLAEKLYITYQSVSGWERGTNPPEIENICKLAEIFDITIDALLLGQSVIEKYMIAVDGGGTKTEFVLFSETGEVIRQEMLAESNPNSVGVENCCKILSRGIDSLRENRHKISAVFAGLAGGASGGGQKIARILRESYAGLDVGCGSDALNVLGFAPDPENAMGIICGTGSNIFVRQKGVLTFYGGWGYLFDDGGSGFDIGRDAVREACAVHDKLKPGSRLAEIIALETGDVRKNLGELYKANVHGIASLAPLVFRAAEEGDGTARAILERNAERMARLMQTAQKESGYRGKVIGGGGLLRDSIYRDLIQEKSGIEIVMPTLPPIYGAAVECCLRVGIRPDDEFYRNFERSYKRRKQSSE